MNKSESIKELSIALAKAQSEIENATKNAVNPHFKNKYADLSEVLNTIRPVFSKNGLALTQFPGYESGLVQVETIITHSSGEWMSGVSACRPTKDDPQGVGSALTYLRRQSAAAVASIAQEDDDGQVASKPVLVSSLSLERLNALYANVESCTTKEELKEVWTKGAEEFLKAKQDAKPLKDAVNRKLATMPSKVAA